MLSKGGGNKPVKLDRSALMSNLAVDYLEDFYDAQNEKDVLKFNKRRKRKTQVKQKQALHLREINPMTANQHRAFAYYDNGDNILLHGVAGTGKTFLSLYLALDELMYGDTNKEKVVIVRSVVPTRDIGFLPGKEHEKTAVYEQPYKALCSEIANRGDAYDVLKAKGKIEFISTSFIRGTTLDDCIVIVDECQNMTFHELDSIITRVGVNTRVLFCGDFRQTDLNKPYDKSGIKEFMNILDGMYYFNKVEFDFEDIVRSSLVKDYIIAKERYNEVHSQQSL